MKTTVKQTMEVLSNSELPEVYKEYPALENYRVQDLAIDKMNKEYSVLRIADIKDVAGYEKVKLALSDVRSKRVLVEKKRVELKADALKYGKVVDAEAKRIRELLEPIESHLESERTKIDSEVEKIKAEKQRLIQEKINARISKLLDAGMLYNPATKEYYYKERKVHEDKVGSFPDELFETALADISKNIEDDKLLKAEEETKREQEREAMRIESERLEKLRAEQEAVRIEQEKKEQSIRDEQKKIQDEKDRIEREKEIEKIKADAKVKAEQEAQEKVKRDAEGKKRIEDGRKAEEQRQKDLAPDVEKLMDFERRLSPGEIVFPILKSKKAQAILTTAGNKLEDIQNYIITETKKL